jgi:hypothetical protein
MSNGTVVPIALIALTGSVLGAFGLVSWSTVGAGSSAGPVVLYNSTRSPLPGNIPSYGAEAYAFNEIGNEVNLAPATQPLAGVTVTMSSWACESGGWTGSPPCTTTPGATYSVPITFSIYHPGTTPGTTGGLIANDTQTFNIPFRPSANPACVGAPTKWMATTGTCYNGLATNITFDFASQGITLPSPIVYGISYSTDHYGPQPIGGSTSPTDSLNVAFTTESSDVSAGSDVNPGNIFVNSASATNTNLFCSTVTPDALVEAPNGCVSGSPPTNDIPAVQFATAGSPAPTGYWEVASDGGIFAFGPQFHGSMGGVHLNAPVVGMASTSDAGGYWEVASDGGIFNFGDAGFFGSAGGQHIPAPIVGVASTPSGKGYWEVGSDGAIYSFGDAQPFGSMAGKPLNAPVVGIAGTSTGKGYWLVASDGGIFNFGDAGFLGSMGGKHLNKPVVGIAGTSTGAGYTEVASDGGVFNFGDSAFAGSMGGMHINKPMVGIAAP